jgi:hypothetical protein
VKKKLTKKIFGLILTTVASLILLLLSLFFWQKFTAPCLIAKILPDSTFGFLELRTNSPKFIELQKIFAEIQPVDLLELDPNLAEILALTNQRFGLAFVGETLDPQNFILILDLAERETALNLLKNQTLANETLLEIIFQGTKIYTFPHSSDLAFAFQGNDLLLASNLITLKKVLANSPRLADTSAYRVAISKKNPRATGFIFLSEEFLQKVFNAQFQGFQKALAMPFGEIWQAAIAEIIPRENGVKIAGQLILKKEYIHSPLFLESEPVELSELAWLGSETKFFFLGQNLSQQFQHFLTAVEPKNFALPMLLRGMFREFSEKLFGADFNLPSDIFDQEIIVGATQTGNFFAIADSVDLSKLKTALLSASGWISSREKNLVLPDGTIGRELVVEKTVREETVEFEGLKIMRIFFPQLELNFVELDTNLLYASDLMTLQDLLNQALNSEKKGLAEIIELAEMKMANLFYFNFDADEKKLFLQPFYFGLVGVNFRTDLVEIEIFLSK